MKHTHTEIFTQDSYINAHWSIIHNSQKVEIAQCLSKCEWIKKMWYIHISHVYILYIQYRKGLPWWLRWHRIRLQCGRPGFDPWVGKIPWRRSWQPMPVFLPGESHGERSLVGHSPSGCKESHNWLPFTHTHTHTAAERNKVVIQTTT